MSTETIRLKLELSSIKTYAGGKDQLLDDIKNAGIVIHNDSNGYYITSESETKYSASTDYAEKLNQLKTLTVLSPEETEIASLNIAFINKDNDNPYAVSDNATIEGETINLTFNSYTLTFTNTEYPQFDIELPDAMIVPEGTSVVLPSVSGSFEDEEYTYTPSAWSIGNFGESIEIDDNTTANILLSATQKELPTVSFIQENLYFNVAKVKATIASNGTNDLSDADGYFFYIDSSHSYSCIKIYSNSDDSTGFNAFDISLFGVTTDSGELALFLRNNRSTSITVQRIEKIADCNSNLATVITVYSSTNEAFNAFKYTRAKKDYYYVLDETQDDWTDNLSSIGYSLEPVPIVTYTLSFTNTTYPDFAVSLPQAITENAGTEITLPSVSGSFEDEDYIYTPSAWSIGEFGSKFILNNNINANLVWKSEEKQPSFVSDRFIDVTTQALALNPIPNYTPNGSFWFDNLSGRMPLSAYTTDTTQDYDFITSGYDDCASLSLNQSEIPTIIWLNAEAQYAPDSSVISALGLTDVINSEPEGSAMLRVITSIGGGTLGNLTFGSITRVEYIKILFCDIVGYNEFEDVNIRDDFGFSINFYRQSTITDTFNVPEEDRFLVEENNETYVAYKTLIPANTVHINGALYDKPLIAEYGENTGLVIYEPTPYDLS